MIEETECTFPFKGDGCDWRGKVKELGVTHSVLWFLYNNIPLHWLWSNAAKERWRGTLGNTQMAPLSPTILLLLQS